MKTTLMTSALAITAVLAYGSIAAAQEAGPISVIDDSFLLGSANGNDNSVDDSNNSLDVDLDVEDSLNDNSTEIEDSFNDNSDNSTEDSGNDNSDNSVEYEDSFNDESEIEDSYNTDNSVENEDSYNTDNSVENEDSFNTDNSVENEDSFNTDNSVENEDSFNTDNSLEVEDSYNSSIEDSYNTDNSQTHIALSLQVLAAAVSDVQFNMGDAGLGGGDANGDIETGAIRQAGGAFAGFAGIQTVTNNTGLASVGQAATSISANANVTFGN